jgi:hypothetical protein
MKFVKCSSLTPCPDQVEFFNKNDSYAISEGPESTLCCSYCGVDLDTICDELYTADSIEEKQAIGSDPNGLLN